MGDIHRGGSSARSALMLRAAKSSVLLSLLFVVVYGSTNWFTAQRPDADVRTWYFASELTAIPYMPLLIVPYMSIDFFFFMATFVFLLLFESVLKDFIHVNLILFINMFINRY